MKLMPVEMVEKPVLVSAIRFLQPRSVGNWIPYNPRLRHAVSQALGANASINATILLSHLEWRFQRTGGKPFCKHLTPRARDAVDAVGGSLTVEVGMTPGQVRRAFREIGVEYNTFGACKLAGGDFRGKPYLRYFDRLRKRTVYMRDQDWFNRSLSVEWFKNRQS